MIHEHGTQRVIWQDVTLYPCTQQGAWYELFHHGEVGTMYAPMNADGTPDLSNFGEVEVAYEDA